MSKALRAIAVAVGLVLALFLASVPPAAAQVIGDPDFDYTTLSDDEFDALLDSIDEPRPVVPLNSVGNYSVSTRGSDGPSASTLKWIILLPLLLLRVVVRAGRR